ncbi:MAG: hypothetical protein K6T28_08920 [Acidothermus sp.]|nr:hypothetical protein [Acidothermus sp.]
MRMLLDGPDLEELLVRAHAECGPNARIVKAEKVRTGGIGGFFARERYELTIETDGDTTAVPDASDTEPSDGKPSPSPASLLDLADAISDREVDESMRSSRPSPRISTEGASFASVLEELTNTVGSSGDDVKPATFPKVDASDPSVLLARASHTYRGTHPATTATLPARLHGLGLPSEILPSDASGDLLAALVTALRSLPPVPKPPTNAGDIFAVVGDGESAWEAATELVGTSDLDERAMYYVTARRAPSRVPPARRLSAVEQIAVRRERWVKYSTPTVVVVDAPMAPAAAEFGRSVLQALGSTATWLVVPATRKTGDVAMWVKRLGSIDALVVTDVEASADPASVLQLGIPVARLDGEIATTRVWGGMIIQRLVEAR